jgi:hypothetical protein
MIGVTLIEPDLGGDPNLYEKMYCDVGDVVVPDKYIFESPYTEAGEFVNVIDSQQVVVNATFELITSANGVPRPLEIST